MKDIQKANLIVGGIYSLILFFRPDLLKMLDLVNLWIFIAIPVALILANWGAAQS